VRAILVVGVVRKISFWANAIWICHLQRKSVNILLLKNGVNLPSIRWEDDAKECLLGLSLLSTFFSGDCPIGISVVKSDIVRFRFFDAEDLIFWDSARRVDLTP
jgi:hypothetical protein